MKYLNGNNYFEVKDEQNWIGLTENIFLGLQKEPKFLRTQYQVQNKTQIRKYQKVIENDNDELVVKINLLKLIQTNNQPQPSFQPPDCPSFKKIGVTL